MSADAAGAHGPQMRDDDETVDYLAGGSRTDVQKRLFNLFQTLGFDAVFAIIVFMNLITVIIESDIQAKGEDTPTSLRIVNYIFLALYMLEIGLRIYVFRFAFFKLPWNCVDLGLVVADFVMAIVDAIMGSAPSLSFLRLLRLLKLTRGIKVMMMFPQLSLMVKGLAKACSIILWGAVILSIALIAFGIFATQLIHPVNERVTAKGIYDGCDRCPRAYASVFNSIVTISQQIIAGDSWGQVSIPVIEEAPETSFFFMSAYSVISLMMLNVILAVVVETSSKAATEDAEAIIRNQEKEFQKSAQTFKAICRELDKDKSGSLTVEELNNGFDNNAQFRQIMTLMQIDRDDFEAVFNILDKDGSGDIDYDEFITELYKMKSHDQHTMLVFMRYYLLDIKRIVQQLVEKERKDTTLVHARLAAMPDVLQIGIAEEKSNMEKMSVAPQMETGEDFRDEITHKVQTALREELAVPMREFLAAVERQANALDDVRQRLALMPSKWREHSVGGAIVHDREEVRAINTPSARCCSFVDARKEKRTAVVASDYERSAYRGVDRRGVLPSPVPPVPLADPYLQGAFCTGEGGSVPTTQMPKAIGSANHVSRGF